MNMSTSPVAPFQISRRDFLKRTAITAAGIGVPAWYLSQTLDAAEPTPVRSANDKPGIALIGCGGQGRNDAKLAAAFGNVVAVCDVDSRRLAEAAQQFGGATEFSDFRKLLARDDVHVVINGT